MAGTCVTVPDYSWRGRAGLGHGYTLHENARPMGWVSRTLLPVSAAPTLGGGPEPDGGGTPHWRGHLFGERAAIIPLRWNIHRC